MIYSSYVILTTINNIEMLYPGISEHFPEGMINFRRKKKEEKKLKLQLIPTFLGKLTNSKKSIEISLFLDFDYNITTK